MEICERHTSTNLIPRMHHSQHVPITWHVADVCHLFNHLLSQRTRTTHFYFRYAARHTSETSMPSFKTDVHELARIVGMSN